MQGWRRQEWTLRRIADELNRLNIRLPVAVSGTRAA
jgi:hypothetical protein